MLTSVGLPFFILIRRKAFYIPIAVLTKSPLIWIHVHITTCFQCVCRSEAQDKTKKNNNNKKMSLEKLKL